ncbi:MAG: triose-phosphate isomerase [Acholeplasmatales bacterium]|nr:triose-phosphate isomerase [Acholeplasmatales bacterium]
MKKFLIAGNWKMYKTKDDSIDFIYQLEPKVKDDDVDVLICAPFISLRSLVHRQGKFISIGAQNMHYADVGAFTGEISALMLKSLGITHVIIGHSERRAMFNDADTDINLKLIQALKKEITPILCVGETLETRKSLKTEEHLLNQLNLDLKDIKSEDISKIVIAYEPIWAIGTGVTATSTEANETILFIRNYLKENYSETIAKSVRILYGGSVNPKNALSLLSEPEIDGALVGGASLEVESFVGIIESARKVVK